MATKASPLKLAIVGCGGIAGAHVGGYAALWQVKKLRRFEIVACCDIERDKAVQMAARIAGFQGAEPAVFDSADEMLERLPEIQAVDVCTLHREHHTVCVPCFEAGKHVTLEKPIGITMRASWAIMAAARDAGTVFQVAENYRFALPERAHNWAVRSGLIGEPQQLYWVDVRERDWYWTWREHRDLAGGGWSMDGGVHYADMFRYNLGEVDTLYSAVEAFNPIRYRDREKRRDPIKVDVEDTTQAVLHFRSGVTGVWVSTTAAPGQGLAHRAIYGAEGSLVWGQGVRTRRRELDEPALARRYLRSLSKAERERLFPLGAKPEAGARFDTFASELNQFITAALGGEAVEIDGYEGLRDVALPFALYESAHQGKAVAVRDVEECRIEASQADLNRELGLRKPPPSVLAKARRGAP